MRDSGRPRQLGSRSSGQLPVATTSHGVWCDRLRPWSSHHSPEDGVAATVQSGAPHHYPRPIAG